MFYDKFVELCKEKGISPSKSAAEIGFDKSSVTNWKKRGYTPKQEILTKIADYFGVTIDYLLGKSRWKNAREEYVAERNLADVGMSFEFYEDEASVWIRYPDGALEICYDTIGPEVAKRKGEDLVEYLKKLKYDNPKDFRGIEPSAVQETSINRATISSYNNSRIMDSVHLNAQLQGIDFALWGEVKELSDAQKQDILDYIKFKKQQKKD